MNTNIITVATGYSLIDLICGSPVLSAECDFLGIRLESEVSTDSQQQFISHMQEAVKSSNILFVVDATKDFQTKNIISKGLEKPLEQNSRALQSVQNYLKRSGQSHSELAYEYANLPKGAVALTNENGLEQGFMLVYPSICIAVLPGSLQSLETVFENEVFPFLLNRLYSGSYTTLVPLLPHKLNDVYGYIDRYGRSKGFMASILKTREGVWMRIAAALGAGDKSQQACDSFLEDITSELGDVSPIKGIAIHGSKVIDKKSAKAVNIIPDNMYDDSLLDIDNLPYVESPKEQKGNKKPKNSKNATSKIKRVLLILVILIFLGAGGYLTWYYYGSFKNKSSYNSLKDVYREHTLIAPSGYPRGYNKDFAALWEINPDVIGWLRLPDTALDYPVVQTKDNEKYYRTNFQGGYSEHAVPFVDADVNLKTPSKNTIIYGHNIRTDGQMFNILRGYQKLDFYQANPIIEFNNVYNKGKYVVFSVFYANTRPEHGQPFPYIEFIDPADDAEMQAYIDGITVRSIFNTGVEVNTSDELLTLSTCTYEYKDARFVVVARKLRGGESDKWDTTNAVINPTPLYPDIWYKLFGGTKPDVNTGSINFSSGKAEQSGSSNAATTPENTTYAPPESTPNTDNSDPSPSTTVTKPKAESSNASATPNPSGGTTEKPAEKEKPTTDSTTTTTDKETTSKPTPETPKDTGNDETKIPDKDKEELPQDEKDDNKVLDKDTDTDKDENQTDNSADLKEETVIKKPDTPPEPSDSSEAEQPKADDPSENKDQPEQQEDANKAPDTVDTSTDSKKGLPDSKTVIMDSVYVSSWASDNDTTYTDEEDKSQTTTPPEQSSPSVTPDPVDPPTIPEPAVPEPTPPAPPDDPPQTDTDQSQDMDNNISGTIDTDKKEDSDNDTSDGIQNNTQNAGSLTVKNNGNTISDSAINIVGAMVEAEMGSTFQEEALKAQAVAAYTYVKYYNNNGSNPSVVMKTPVTSKVASAVSSVIGQAVYYNGSYAEATYSASSAGKTNAAIDYWGGKGAPYLVSVDSPGDELVKAFGTKKTFTESEVAQRIQSYYSIDPYSFGDPSSWFSNPEYVSGKYIKSVQVCGKTVTGREVRDNLLQYKINSNAFEVSYDGSSFLFTTYGYGHGVGLSQQGSDYYAKQGWGYKEILTHYYPGTSVN